MSVVIISAIFAIGGFIFLYYFFSKNKTKNAPLAEAANVADTNNTTNSLRDFPVDNPPSEPSPQTDPETINVARAIPSCPAKVLNLTDWKQTLPTGKSKSPTEIKQPALAAFTMDSCFKVNSTGDGVIFRAPVNGVTTSGSGYPRSELREMTNGGKNQASWSTTSGTHSMFIDEAITAVPETKRHIVAGQIHDADDDVVVVRLEYPKLFIDINGKEGPTLDSNYTLGKRFTVQFVASNGQIKIYYNGGQTPVYTLSKKGGGYYFKAGAYPQSNCFKEKNCSSSNFGEVVIYQLQVNH